MSADKIQSWHDLLVWQKAHAATLEIYRITKAFPADERYRFLIIARGSIEETRYLLLLARDLGLLASEAHVELKAKYTEISKMTNALLRSLKP